MKKFIVLGLLIAGAMVLSSCGPKGGTIKVVNEYKIAGQGTQITIAITAVVPLTAITENIPAGQSKEFSFDEDGTFTITSVPGTASPKTVDLSGGESVTVTVK